MTRPRTADDFAAIRARMQELQRERLQIAGGEEPTTPEGSRPRPVGRRGTNTRPRLLPQILRAIARAETT